MIGKNCDFCKKVREKIFNNAKQYVEFHLNVQKILNIGKEFENKNLKRVEELRYTFKKTST